MPLAGEMTFGQLADAARRGTLFGSLGRGAGADTPATLSPATGAAIAQVVLSDVRRRFQTSTAPDGTPWQSLRHPRPNGGDKPLLDTGQLMASIHATHDDAGVTIATTHPGAAIQNFGGTIVPVKAKKLAIPLTREAKRAGGPRRFPRKMFVARTTKPGVLRLVESVRGRLVGQFLLVDSVKIPARPFMGVSRQALGVVEQIVLDAYLAEWAGMGGA